MTRFVAFLLLATPLVAGEAGCHHDPHRPDPAFVATCSARGSETLPRAENILRVAPHWRTVHRHGADETVVRGAEIHLRAHAEPAALEDALRCAAARVDRREEGREGSLAVSSMTPDIRVEVRAGAVVVVLAVETDRDGQRVLDAAQALVLRATAMKAEASSPSLLFTTARR